MDFTQMKLTKEVPNEVENIYSLFEKLLTNTIHFSREMCLNKWSGEFEYTGSKCTQYIIDTKCLENIFNDDIQAIKIHLIEQFKTYNQIQLVSFIENQNINFPNYLPEKRKRNIYNNYLQYNIAHGDESILKSKFELSEDDKMFLKHIYTQYNNSYHALKDSAQNLFDKYVLNKNNNPYSKLTYLLQLYFEKECKPLDENQVTTFAEKNNIPAKKTFIKYWQKLKGERYNHTDNTNNIKEFFRSYEALMKIFKDSNATAFNEVEKRYKTLKEAYSDISY